jgi:hypothetical protein
VIQLDRLGESNDEPGGAIVNSAEIRRRWYTW